MGGRIMSSTSAGWNVTIFSASLFLCSLIAPAWADNQAVEKYKNYTPEQIRDIPDQERDKSVPMMYIMAARRGLAMDGKLAITMDLNSLMYPGVSNYIGAVKAFQADMGEKATSVLTVWQISKLEQRAEIQRLSPVGFPGDFSSYITDNSAAIQGTFVILDDKIAWPVNYVKVNCYKSDKYCEVSQIVLIFPNDKSWSQTYQVMDLGTEIYTITRWENGYIDAVSESGPDACRIVSLNYNFKAKEFFEITRNADHECTVLDTALPKLEKPRTAQIVDGTKIIQEEFRKISQRAYGYLASDFRKQVDELDSAAPENGAKHR